MPALGQCNLTMVAMVTVYSPSHEMYVSKVRESVSLDSCFLAVTHSWEGNPYVVARDELLTTHPSKINQR